MTKTNTTNNNSIIKQLILPLEIEKIINISDPVYTFCNVMDHIDLKSYFVGKGCKTGRPRCDSEKLLKVTVAVKNFVAKISQHYIAHFKFILYI